MSDPLMKQAFARAIVVGNHVHVAEQTTVVGKPRPIEKAEPQLEVIREGNLIRAIDIQCICGEVIRIRLDYE